MSNSSQKEPPVISMGEVVATIADPPRVARTASSFAPVSSREPAVQLTDTSLPDPEFASAELSTTQLATQQLTSSPLITPLITPPVAAPPVIVEPNALEKNVPEVANQSAADDLSEVASSAIAAESEEVAQRRRWYQWPFWLLGRTWDVACLCVLIAVVAAIPIVQFASLGYLLLAAANLANGRPWSTALPGLRLAGKLGTFAMLVALSWIPVYILTDLSYSAQLLQPGSNTARAWRIGVFLFAFAWVVHVGWAALRGGRWWHFVWPAPLKFFVTIWRPPTWSRASDQLYDLVAGLQFPKLWWLGARASAGALLWTCVPVSLMIIGQRAQDFQLAGLVGFIGALSMAVVMLYLPVLQVHMAARNRFVEIFNAPAARRTFMLAPWFYALSVVVLCALAIPLYLLRIEATPSQLVWAPSLVFVLFMFPAKLLIGTALGYASHRTRPRHWALRWPAWGVELVAIAFYVGALYVAQFVAWQGAYVMYFQHAVLLPAPLISS